MFVTTLGNVDIITLGLDIGTDLGFYMDHLMVLMKASLREYFLETHWDLLMVYRWALTKAPLDWS